MQRIATAAGVHHRVEHTPTAARELVDQVARGGRLLAQIGSVRPILAFDLTVVRADIVESRDECHRMHAAFQTSPHRWASVVQETIDPFTDKGYAVLSLHQDTVHDVLNPPTFFATCSSGDSQFSDYMTALVPREPGSPAPAAGERTIVRIQIDEGTEQQIVFVADNDMPSGVSSWHMARPSQRDQGALAIAAKMQGGTRMTLDGFGLPTMRFNLVGGRREITRFNDLCDRMPKLDRNAQRETDGYQ